MKLGRLIKFSLLVTKLARENSFYIYLSYVMNHYKGIPHRKVHSFFWVLPKLVLLLFVTVIFPQI